MFLYFSFDRWAGEVVQAPWLVSDGKGGVEWVTIATKFHNSYILKPPAFRKHILHGVFFKHFVFVFARTNSKVYPVPSSGDFSFKHLCGFVDFCGMATADSQHSKCPALKSSQK